MINKLYRLLYKILPKQRIPKLPRGFLSSDFEQMTRDERRVLARLGARDPRGIMLAMKRAGVHTKEELIELLEHQQPRRDFKRRLDTWICTLQNATNYDPHQRAILADARRAERARRPENREMARRLKTVTKAFEES